MPFAQELTTEHDQEESELLSELEYIRREFTKAIEIQTQCLEQIDKLSSELERENDEILSEIEKVVGNRFFTTKRLFAELPAAIEEFGPDRFPHLNNATAKSIGKRLAAINDIGRSGGFEVARSTSVQGWADWQIIAL